MKLVPEHSAGGVLDLANWGIAESSFHCRRFLITVIFTIITYFTLFCCWIFYKDQVNGIQWSFYDLRYIRGPSIVINPPIGNYSCTQHNEGKIDIHPLGLDYRRVILT